MSRDTSKAGMCCPASGIMCSFTFLCFNYFPSEASSNESDETAGEVEALSVELRQYIQEDNWRFQQEVEEWEEEQSCKIPQMESSPNSSSQDFSTSQGMVRQGLALPPHCARSGQVLAVLCSQPWILSDMSISLFTVTFFLFLTFLFFFDGRSVGTRAI